MADTDGAMVSAFPSRLADDVRAVMAVMPAARYRPMSPFSVDVGGEAVAIPYRIHHDEPPAHAESTLTTTQGLILHCLYSRHGDGLVRQRHLEQIIASSHVWVAPFVVQLVGEYVLEILEAVHGGLPELDTPQSTYRLLYGAFIARNPSFCARTERRVVSYWSCYYRWRYPVFGTYPGCILMESLRDAAADHTGRPWPRHTPPGLADPARPS